MARGPTFWGAWSILFLRTTPALVPPVPMRGAETHGIAGAPDEHQFRNLNRNPRLTILLGQHAGASCGRLGLARITHRGSYRACACPSGAHKAHNAHRLRGGPGPWLMTAPRQSWPTSPRIRKTNRKPRGASHITCDWLQGVSSPLLHHPPRRAISTPVGPRWHASQCAPPRT